MIDAALMGEIPRVASDSFDQVVRQREAQVLRTAYRMLGNWADAEDVAQEAFVRLHRHGLSFPSDAVMNAWLYRVSVNLCLDRTRARRPLTELHEIASVWRNAEAEVQADQDKQRLMQAMSQLPERE